MRKILLVAAVLTLALPTRGEAQDYGTGGMDSFISASNNNVLTTNVIVGGATFRSSLKNKVSSPKAAGTTKVRAPKRVASVADLSFRPSPAVRQKSNEQFFALMRSVDAEGATQLEASYPSGDLFPVLEQALAPYGMRANNVADAMTVWMVNLWMGANGLSEDPPKSQIRAVRTQIADSLRTSSDLATASDATKQELTESLLLNAAIIGSALGDSRVKSGEMRGALQTAMQQVGNSLGMDLTAVRITRTGFVGY
jgi:hypothetical protein